MWGRCVVTTSLRTLPPSSNEGFFQVLFANTLHAYFTLIVVAYPSTSLSLATLLLSYGTSFMLHLFLSYMFIFVRNSHRRMDFKRCRFSVWRRGSSPYTSFNSRNVCYCEQDGVYEAESGGRNSRDRNTLSGDTEALKSVASSKVMRLYYLPGQREFKCITCKFS